MQMIQLSPTSRDNSEESEDACEILATEDREESQSEEIKRNSQASQSVGMQRMSMKRNRDTGMSSINQWNKKTYPTPSHAKGIGKHAVDSEGEDVLEFGMYQEEDSADEEIPDEAQDSEDYEQTLDYRQTYTSIDERLPTPTPREKKTHSFVSQNISRELRKRVLSTDKKSFAGSFLINESIDMKREQKKRHSTMPFEALNVEPWRAIQVNELIILKSLHSHLL